MATTSSNLTAGAAITAQGGNGKGGKRRAAGLVATAALGLGLLGGLIVGQLHQVPPSAGAQDLYILQGSQPMYAPAAPQSWAGTCRAGGVDCVPDEDYAAPAPPSAARHGWTGTCRAGGVDCVPDEDILAVGPNQAADTFVPDQFTYREGHRGETPTIVASPLPAILRCDCWA